MANLIIKSSADNLVLQGSDASPAITVGATGTTTFAENATLSGTANVLGTINSTGTTFPAGHVLKFERGFLSTQASSGSGASPGTTTGLAVTITPSSASNKIALSVNLGAVGSTSGGTVAFNIWSSLTSGIIGVGTGITGNEVGSGFRTGTSWNGDTTHSFGASWGFVDFPTTWSSGSITYTLYMWREAGTAYINRSANYVDTAYAYGVRVSSTITAMEIQV